MKHLLEESIMRSCMCLNGVHAGQKIITDVSRRYWTAAKADLDAVTYQIHTYEVCPMLKKDGVYPFTYVLVTPDTTPDETTRLYHYFGGSNESTNRL